MMAMAAIDNMTIAATGLPHTNWLSPSATPATSVEIAACHQIGRHKMAARIGGSLIGSCIDCHMPNERSRSIQINTPTTQSSLSFRSHLIGIYPKATAAVLR